MRRSWVTASVAMLGCGAPIANQPVARTAQPVVVASHRDHPGKLAADATGAYWVEGSAVWHVPLSTSPATPTTVATVTGEITALAVANGTIYLAVAAPDDGPSRIVRVHTGKPEEPVVGKLDYHVDLLAADGEAVYFGDGGGDFSKVVASQPPRSIAGSPEYSYADHLAIDANNVYWSNELDDTPRRIYRVAKTGGDVVQLNDAGVSGWTVTADGAVYYAGRDGVRKVTGAGTSRKLGDADAHTVAVAGDRLLFVTDDNVLHEISTATGAPAPLHAALGDGITATAFAAGALWFTRDAEIGVFVP